MCKRLIVWLFIAQAIALPSLGANPAPPAPGKPDSATNSPAATATNATIVPLAEIPAQTESDSAAMQAIEAELAADRTTASVQKDLPTITQEITLRLEENSKILSRNRTLELLRKLASEWHELRDELTGWRDSLTKRAKLLEEDKNRLSEMNEKWAATSKSREATNMPPELAEKLKILTNQISDVQGKVDAQQNLDLTLQTRIAEQNARVDHAISTIESAREELVGHLFARDALPIWSPELRSNVMDLAQQSQYSLSRQRTALGTYAARKPSMFVLHGIIFLFILAAVFWARRKLHAKSDPDSDLRRVAVVFDVPIATALVLALFASSWIYPQAPRLLWSIAGAAALIPAAIVLRRVVARELYPFLNVVIVFYFLDQLRSVVAAPEFLFRVLFLAEILIGIIFACWFLKSGRFRAMGGGCWAKAFCAATRVALVLLVGAFISNVVGYGTLSKLLGHGTIISAYPALVLYALIRIADGLILSVLSLQSLAHLKIVEQHRLDLHRWMLQVIEWAAVCVWVLYMLETLSLRAPLFQNLKSILTANLSIKSTSFTLGDILLFVVTIWATVIASRIARFILEQEVYPHVQLAPGVHYSISRMVHYIILVGGFLTAMVLLGFNLTHLTILVGAVGVGLGFGLQNIINNFVSGIILLFERPVKVGDVIQIDATEGVVAHIGIRASIVKTTAGSEIIVPNGKLISDPVTNWTFSRRQRLIIIPIGIAPGTEAKQVLEVLNNAAAAEPAVLGEPRAQALLVNFSGGALNFELRVWTDQIKNWMEIRSNLSAAINSSLIAQKISLK
jgi:small-conductance mechanosensitive channel